MRTIQVQIFIDFGIVYCINYRQMQNKIYFEFIQFMLVIKKKKNVQNLQIKIYIIKKKLMKGDTQLNQQIRLTKIPTDKYPNQERDIFQIKFVAPTPTSILKNSEVIVENAFISIDASMRLWINGLPNYVDPVKQGQVMKSLVVGKVVFSKSDSFKVGDKVMGYLGWEKYSVCKDKELTKIPNMIKKPQNFLILGISGISAYFGLNKIGKVKEKQIVVISAAAGGVGMFAVQYAKSKGCIVCGIAGGTQKCKFVKETLGADYIIDYKNSSVKQKLKQLFPQGINVYFDNVGGQMLDDVLMNIAQDSRIVLCGAISNYNYIGLNQNKNNYYKLKNYPRLIIKRAVMKGFIMFDYVKEYSIAFKELNDLIENGQIKVKVDMLYGLDSCPQALVKLLKGQNLGKIIVDLNQNRPRL